MGTEMEKKQLRLYKGNAERINETVDFLCKEFGPDMPGTCIGIAVDGELIFSKGYGCANLSYLIPITADTVFHCCSIAKQFTGVCAVLLQEAGKLSFDDLITDYFPELPVFCNKITVSNLIFMTHGLFDYYNISLCVCGIPESKPFSENKVWQFIKACMAPMYEPGERWEYGDIGYFLLGRLVEKISGQKLSQFAKEHIFDVLGMKDTLLRDDKSKIILNAAMGYQEYDRAHMESRDYGVCGLGDRFSECPDNMEITGASQFWTTLNDLVKWNRNFYDNKLGLKKQNLIRLLTTSGKRKDGRLCGYGIGLFCSEDNGERCVWHGGSFRGYNSYSYNNLTQKFSVMILGNHPALSEKINGWIENRVFDQIMHMALGEKTTTICGQAETVYEREDVETGQAESISGQTDTASFSTEVQMTKSIYNGLYYDPDASVIWKLSEDSDGTLVVDGYGQNLILVPDGGNQYHTADGSTVWVFNKADRTFRSGRRVFYPFHSSGLSEKQLAEYTGYYYNSNLCAGYFVSEKDGMLSVRNIDLDNTLLNLNYRPILLQIPVNGICSFPCDTFLAEDKSVDYFFLTFIRNKSEKIEGFVYRDDEGTGREMFLFSKVDGRADSAGKATDIDTAVL